MYLMMLVVLYLGVGVVESNTNGMKNVIMFQIFTNKKPCVSNLRKQNEKQ